MNTVLFPFDVPVAVRAKTAESAGMGMTCSVRPFVDQLDSSSGRGTADVRRVGRCTGVNDGTAALVSEVVLGAKESKPSDVGVLTSKDGSVGDRSGMVRYLHTSR